MTDEQTTSLIKTLLRPPIAFHRVFAEITDSVTAGVFLSQAWYWAQSESVKKRDGWFWKTTVDWTVETGLTRHEQATVRKLLKKKGFLEDERRGTPPKVWYRLNVLFIAKAIFNLPKSGKLIRRKAVNQFAEKRQSRLPLFGKSSLQEQRLHAETTQQAGTDVPLAEVAAAAAHYKQVTSYVRATKRHATNPGGLAKHLIETGAEQEDIAAWVAIQEQRQVRPEPTEPRALNHEERAMLIELADMYLDLANGSPLNDEQQRIVTAAQPYRRALAVAA